MNPFDVCITSGAASRLVEICTAELPHEACGVLGSSRLKNACGLPAPIEAVYLITNAASDPVSRFDFDGPSWVDAYFRMTRNRQSLAGFFHSHPSGSPAPSPHDLAGLPPGFRGSYWIVAFDRFVPDARPSIRAFHVGPDEQETTSMLAEIRVQIV